MARTVDPALKQKILEACASAALRSGPRNLSLNSLSKEIKVSSRMLIYHFGTVEALIEETLQQIQIRVRSKLKDMISKDPNKSTGRAILSIWQLGTSADMESFFCWKWALSAETLKVRRKKSDFIEHQSDAWIQWAMQILSDHAPKPSILDMNVIHAILQGLFLDYWTTREIERTTKVLKHFLKTVSIGK